jgi:hypothetical protein
MSTIPLIHHRHANQEAVASKLRALLPGGVRRVLFVCPPESPESAFETKVARAKRYPCFPPYGPGVLCAHIEERGYETSLLDLRH